MAQLTLAIQLDEQATFDNYFNGTNVGCVQTLLREIKQRQELFLYLYGAPATGRSHLLQACVHEAIHQGKTAFYFSCRDAAVAPSLLEGLASHDVICIDDIDAVLGDSKWESGLFHCFNAAREAGHLLIMSGDQPPQHGAARLADLRSRLAWGLSFQLKPLDDAQKALALQMRAQARGLALSAEVAQYLLSHHSRDWGSLMQLLNKLDDASMTAQRKLTIPFVRQVLSVE